MLVARGWLAPVGRAVLLAALLAGTGAAADETVTEARLQGAWSVDAGICAQVFTFKDGKPRFLKEDGIIDSGFIVDGKTVRGLMETCRVVGSRAASQSGRTLTLSCASSVSGCSRSSPRPAARTNSPSSSSASATSTGSRSSPTWSSMSGSSRTRTTSTSCDRIPG